MPIKMPTDMPTDRIIAHSAAWRGPSADRRIAGRARGLRVYAILVGVAVLSGRVTIRGRARR